MIQPITTRQITKKNSPTGATKNLKKSRALNELNMKETKGANLRRFRLNAGGTGENPPTKRWKCSRMSEPQKKILILQMVSY